MRWLPWVRRYQFYGWVGLVSLALSILSNAGESPGDFAKMAVNEAWRSLYLITLSFWFFEWAVPRFSFKKPGRSLLILLASVFLAAIGMALWRRIGIGLHVYTSFATARDTRQSIIGDQFGSSIGCLFLFGIVRHIYNHIHLRKTAQQLRIEKQAAELNYLKSQTNPHFLFNTLNNIYSLSRDKSDLAPEAILRLSKILRYMLYETTGAYIAVEQELKIMNDYIALEQLRYDDSLRVNFNHDIEDMKQALPPLLLIPLVENAFKHGVSETRNSPFVEIHLSIRQRKLSFLVKNSSGAVQPANDLKENIGLSNLRRQLELQFTDFSLDTKQEAGVFIAQLKINLSSHA
ncbi:MAG: histidine kinase [Bacteroidota bacterium]